MFGRYRRRETPKIASTLKENIIKMKTFWNVLNLNVELENMSANEWGPIAIIKYKVQSDTINQMCKLNDEYGTLSPCSFY